MVQTVSLHSMRALGKDFDSAARLSKRPGSVCGTVYGDMHLKRSPGINGKSRVSYPGPEFLSNATWPLLQKKHYNGLINQSIIFLDLTHNAFVVACTC